MRKVWILILTVLLLLTLAPACFGQQIWSEMLISASGGWYQGGAKVWGTSVYYGNAVSGVSEVFVWDEAQGSRRLLGGDGIPRAPGAVWGDNLVVTRIVNNQYDLYLYDPVNGERPVVTAAGNQYPSDIYEGTVVWEDHRGTYSQIYIWDPVNGERAVSPAAWNQTKPKVWGDTITWEQQTSNETPDGSPHVFKWNPTDGLVDLGWGYSPAVYDGRIVGWQPAYQWWSDLEKKWYFVPGHLWQWTAAGGRSNLADHNWTTGFQNTDMWGDLVAAEYGRAWDPAHGFTYNAVNQPSVYGNQVVGVRNNNVYLETLVPEPGSVLILTCFAAGLGFATHRRRCK